MMATGSGILAARNEAIERIGKWLYGDDWIGELNRQEWQLGRQADDLPADPKAAARAARARFRNRASDEQYELVFRWLQVTWKIDCLNFNAAQFEEFWKEHFPQVATIKDARLAAIRKRWNEGERPGANRTWKEFTNDVCSDCGAQYDVKTIRNDVREMFGEATADSG